ncbi:MAG: hypothetical protein QCH96_00435 [Candidatus Thermoplasmatota archaeon]|jgi:hypothetical protein|nr:hypothetical protein [Candidatus Thermoplasmatota archaeon]
MINGTFEENEESEDGGEERGIKMVHPPFSQWENIIRLYKYYPKA